MAMKNETNDAVIRVEDPGAVSSPRVDVQYGLSSPPQQPDEENSQPAEKGTAKDDDTIPDDGEKQKGKRTFSTIVQSFLFACSIGFLVTSLKVDVLKNHVIGGLKLWKWCALASVIFFGRQLMGLIIKAAISLIKRRFAFIKRKAYYSYFIYDSGRSIGVFLWLCSVSVTWYLLFHISEVKGSKSYLLLHGYQIRHYVSMSLATLSIGGLLWVVKTLLVNILSSSFKFGRFFDRVQQSIIDLYILEVFSAYIQETSSLSLVRKKSCIKKTKSVRRWVNKRLPKHGDQQVEEGPAINLLKKTNEENASAWTMEEFVEMIRCWDSFDDIKQLHDFADQEMIMESNSRTERAAELIYYRVQSGTDGKGIFKDDLIKKVKFQEKDVVHVIQRINGESGGEPITKSALKDWLASSYTHYQTYIYKEKSILQIII
ncbi:hypothetical protein SLEP1_g24885 [Rubroshorea leprosula]|uniref:Uncharacterized protein n=1 Tax=Rubroshorea leprosula TaxID=152421 RepID=A0AAV5JME1_9ROSI|nr:hypothetical protein SLEP1_g24885 [Rubroshorea leprosula]